MATKKLNIRGPLGIVTTLGDGTGDPVLTRDATTKEVAEKVIDTSVFLSSTLPDSQIFIGNSSNIATARPVSGAFTISNLGVAAIAANYITNNMVNSAAAIAYSKLNLTGSIVNADIHTTANIAVSKLALTTDSIIKGVAGVGAASTDLPTAITIGSAYIYRVNGTDVSLNDGGTGASLTDPNADRILFWDDSAGAITWLSPGIGLSITDTTINAAVDGSGATGRITIWSDADTLSSDSLLTWNSTHDAILLGPSPSPPVAAPGTGSYIWASNGGIAIWSAANTILSFGSGVVGSRTTAVASEVVYLSGGTGVSGATTGQHIQITTGDGFGTGNTNSGNMFFVLGIGNGSGLDGNFLFTNVGTPDTEGMERGIFIDDAKTAPSAAPVDGVFIYSQGGQLKAWYEGAGSPFTIGSALPGGSDTQVQFNDSTSFGGDSGFTYNKTTDVATLIGGLVIGNGGSLKTSTSAGNTLLLQAYDVDGASYTTFGTLTANNTPTFDLADSVTKASNYIYRGGGTDVAIADGGTGASTAAGARLALAVESRTIWINNNSSGLTGTLTETKVASFEIAANTIGANDIIEIVVICTKSGTAGSMNPRAYFNTTDTIGGSQVMVNSSTATNLWNGTIRRGTCKNATNSQVWYNLSNANDDMTSTNSAKQSTSIDFTAAQWIIISNQLGNVGDTATVESVTLRIYRQS